MAAWIAFTVKRVAVMACDLQQVPDCPQLLLVSSSPVTPYSCNRHTDVSLMFEDFHCDLFTVLQFCTGTACLNKVDQNESPGQFPCHIQSDVMVVAR